MFLPWNPLGEANITNPLQVVTDSQQALDYLSGMGQYANRTQYPLPFIVFLDLKLPFIDGFEILTWIRQKAALKSSDSDCHDRFRRIPGPG